MATAQKADDEASSHVLNLTQLDGGGGPKFDFKSRLRKVAPPPNTGAAAAAAAADPTEPVGPSNLNRLKVVPEPISTHRDPFGTHPNLTQLHPS